MLIKEEVRTTVPIERLQSYLKNKIVRYGSKEAVARKLGVSSRRLDEYLTGVRNDSRLSNRKFTSVTISQADKIAIKLDDHLIDIDPTLYE